MEPLFSDRIRASGVLLIVLLLVTAILGGCQTKEPPLSRKAIAFKKEVQDCLDRLCPGLVRAISNGNLDELNETLKKIEPQTIKLCRMCPFRIGILNSTGKTVTVYPFNKEAMADYSNYEGVAQTLKNRRINQQRFYLQDGSQLYLIFVPLLKDNNLAGIMALSLSAKDAQNHWGITENEFMKINFNYKRYTPATDETR